MLVWEGSVEAVSDVLSGMIELVGFGHAAPRTRLFRLINTHNGALRASQHHPSPISMKIASRRDYDKSIEKICEKSSFWGNSRTYIDRESQLGFSYVNSSESSCCSCECRLRSRCPCPPPRWTGPTATQLVIQSLISIKYIYFII